MSLEFLSPDAATESARFTPVARSPMHRRAAAAGARFAVRDGWSVATDYGAPADEAQACHDSGAWIDVSHLGKLEVQAQAADLRAIAAACAEGIELEIGRAARAAGAWWCPVTPTRMLVLCQPQGLGRLRDAVTDAAAGSSGYASVTDLTSAFGALTLAGPRARDIFARFCAIDLRPQGTPLAGLRPGSIARQPGVILREGGERFLFLFGAAVAEYMWAVVDDAGRHLGAIPAGVDALEPVDDALVHDSLEASFRA
jgi:heterotetrameric sarcosine oxidase gamma subunit